MTAESWWDHLNVGQKTEEEREVTKHSETLKWFKYEGSVASASKNYVFLLVGSQLNAVKPVQNVTMWLAR